jgi:hypothetical protein
MQKPKKLSATLDTAPRLSRAASDTEAEAESRSPPPRRRPEKGAHVGRESVETIAELRQAIESLRLFGTEDPAREPLLPWRAISPDDLVRSGAPMLFRAASALESALKLGANTAYAEWREDVRSIAKQRCAHLFLGARARAAFEDTVESALLVRLMSGLGQRRGLVDSSRLLWCLDCGLLPVAENSGVCTCVVWHELPGILAADLESMNRVRTSWSSAAERAQLPFGVGLRALVPLAHVGAREVRPDVGMDAMRREEWRNWARREVERTKRFVEFERIDVATASEVRACRVELMGRHRAAIGVALEQRGAAAGLDPQRARELSVQAMPWVLFSVYVATAAELGFALPEPFLTLATVLGHGGAAVRPHL